MKFGISYRDLYNCISIICNWQRDDPSTRWTNGQSILYFHAIQLFRLVFGKNICFHCHVHGGRALVRIGSSSEIQDRIYSSKGIPLCSNTKQYCHDCHNTDVLSNNCKNERRSNDLCSAAPHGKFSGQSSFHGVLLYNHCLPSFYNNNRHIYPPTTSHYG